MDDGNVEDEEDEDVRPGSVSGSGGRGAARGSTHGRRYVGGGGGGGAEGSKRTNRSNSSAGSEESFVEGQGARRWDPLTPPDRRLRAAGSSPGCVLFLCWLSWFTLGPSCVGTLCLHTCSCVTDTKYVISL